VNIDLELNKVEEKPKIVPTLFDIHKSFNVIKVKNHFGIKGEFRPRMVVFTNFILGNKPIILTGSRGCLTEDTLIFTSKGLLTIKEIRSNINKYVNDLEVVSFNNKEFVFSPVNALWENGNQKVYEVITRSGRKLKCTDNHPFYNSMRWVTIKDGLSKGDIISLPDKILPKPKREFKDVRIFDNSFARVIGYLIADGGLSQNTMLFHNQNIHSRQDFIRCLKILGVDFIEKKERVVIKKKKGIIYDFLKKEGLLGKLSVNKFIPKEMFSWSADEINNFFSAYLMTDSYINKRYVEIYTSSKKLSNDLLLLLQQQGYIFNKYYKKAKCNGKEFDSWRLIAYSKQARNFLKSLILFGER